MSEQKCWDFHIKYRWWELINDWVNCSKEIEKIKKSELVDDYVWRIICKEKEEIESLRSQLKTAVEALEDIRYVGTNGGQLVFSIGEVSFSVDCYDLSVGKLGVERLNAFHNFMEKIHEALKKLKGEEVRK